MIIGDLNGRIGSYQNPITHYQQPHQQFEEIRRSKDDVTNSNGRLLIELFEDYGFFVVNGISKGDKNGEHTFISGQGQSVIDICAISGEWLDSVDDFEVLNANYSGHLPIALKARFSEEVDQMRSNAIQKLRWVASKAERYESLLNHQCRHLPIQTLTNIDEIEESIIRAVHNAGSNPNNHVSYNFKCVWFDKDCIKLRNLSFKYLKLFRSNNLEVFKTLYLRTNREYKQLCQQKRLHYLKNIANKINQARNSKEFWHSIFELSPRNHYTRNYLEAETIATHFKILLTADESLHSFSYALQFEQVPELDCPINLRELELTLMLLKNNKAPGCDGIPLEFFKYSTVELKTYLVEFFNKIYNDACPPISFMKAIIFAIFKKGDPLQPESYRGISILNSLRKIFASILYNRLSKWVENTSRLSAFQAGFRSGFSTTDHIFALTSIARKFIENKKKMYVCFVDFKAAFDTVNRQALIYKLASLGISRKLLEAYSKLIATSSAAVWDGTNMSEWFSTSAGVPQGCILSPLLFSLYIDGIVDILPGGVSFAGQLIKVLLYADDLVLLADNPLSLQLQLNKLLSFCNLWDLKINASKTKVMIFESRNRTRQREENWKIGSESIEVVQNFKYLGITISFNLNFDTHARQKSQDAKLALNLMWPKIFSNPNIDLVSKYKIFDATVNTCLCYGVQAFGISPIEEFEKTQRYFFKRLFRLPNSTPTYAIHVESGLPPIYIRNLKAHSDFLVRVMCRNENSLHRKILERLMATNASPFREWNQMALSHNLAMPTSIANVGEWKDMFERVIAKVDEQIFNQHIIRACSSESRAVYKNLNHQMLTGNKYFDNCFSAEIISLIFRARVELLDLNFIPHRNDRQQTCDLCNRRELENVNHFIAVCPMLQEIRRLYFNESFLNQNGLYEILNGSRGWECLFRYCKHALSYRNSF